MKKLVVYTALFGDYDTLIDPPEKFDDCDFVCFTDRRNLLSDIWNIKIVENIDLSPNLMNRKYKWLPHIYLSDYEYSLYIDANIVLLRNPREILEEYRNWLILLPKHPERNCVYEEAKACIIYGKAKVQDVIEQMIHYRAEGFPLDFILSENNIIFRIHNNSKVIKVMENVWKELLRWKTRRDQLCFPYVIWKKNFLHGVKFMKYNSREGIFFSSRPHRKDDKFFAKFLNKVLIVKRWLWDRSIFEAKSRYLRLR